MIIFRLVGKLLKWVFVGWAAIIGAIVGFWLIVLFFWLGLIAFLWVVGSFFQLIGM